MALHDLRLSLTLVATLAASGAQAANLYSQNFETDTAGVSGAGFITPTLGYAALGFGTTMFRNGGPGNPAPSTVISFTAGSALSGGTLDFDLAVIDSWDGNSALGGCCNTDLFSVTLDGLTVFSADFNNVWSFVTGFNGVDTQTFPRDGRMLAGPIADLAGEWNGSNGFDSAYRLSVALGDLTAGAHTLEFFAGGPGWQELTDESFAIDNIRVSAVPVPGSVWLMGSALLGVGLRHRR